MKKIKLNTFILLSFLFIFSCKKEKTDTVKTKSNYEKILEGKWVLNSVFVSPPLNGDTDVYKTFPVCLKDDTLIYKTDSLLIYKTGNNKCSSGESDIVFYKWYMKDDSIIGLNGAESNIIQLDENTLVHTSKQTINTKVYTYKSTYLNKK